MKEWFNLENTEGYDENTLKEMNIEMQKVFNALSDEEKGNESYIDHLMEKILSSH